ncbi:hypothetical protein J5X84_13195 [Streptosporangiaceae bacterium NEAU-GS5]|nr:hypothetical protein [Streptosporangiaceae bacterium NEAU-GS5]
MKTIRRAVVAAGASAALLGIMPGIAQAAGGYSFNVPVTGGVAVLPTTIVAGDCRLMGRNQDAATRVTIQPSFPGRASVTWIADVYTVSTFRGDVWHQTFVFKTASGATLTTARFDAPIGLAHRIYNYRRSVSVPLSAGYWSSIAKVDWYGDC